MLDFVKAWSEGSTRRKREIQKAIFPNGLPFSIRRGQSSDFEPSKVIKGQTFESVFDSLRPIGVPDGTVLNHLAAVRLRLYAVCEVFEGKRRPKVKPEMASARLLCSRKL